LRIEGADKLVKALRGLRGLSAEASRFFAGLILREARRIAPKKTGRLRESIGVRRIRSGYEVVMGGGRAPYAAYLEFGARPHLIRPRRARALRFEIRGELVYARYVEHPGTRPMRIMARAVAEASRDFDDGIGDLISDLMRKIL